MNNCFEQYYEKVCATIYPFVKDKASTEDVAQLVFIKLWEKRQSLQITASLSAYIRRMAINEALMFLRKQKSFVEDTVLEHHQDNHQADYHTLEKDIEQQYQKALHLLPPKCKAIFLLSRQEHLSYKEIAAQLEISVKTVENQISKALKILRVALNDYFPILFLMLFDNIVL